MPVYVVKAENGTGGERVLHRNMLLPCDHLPLETQVEADAPKTKKNKAKTATSQNEPMAETPLDDSNFPSVDDLNRPALPNIIEESSDSDSDDEDDLCRFVDRVLLSLVSTW